MQCLTLNKLRNSAYRQDDFYRLYKELITKEIPTLSLEEKLFLLKLAIIFLNQNDGNINKLGYRIILEYSTKFSDYEPLYETAINQGYIPIVKFIEKHHLSKEQIDSNFFLTWLSSFNENFKRGDIYLSCQQKSLFEDFTQDQSNNIAVIAPTSYGKSELIIAKVKENLDKKICIIVPSKALLAQTKRRLIKHDDICRAFRKIITHPELYKGNEENLIAVLTQERLQALMNKYRNAYFDCIFIDEAHNIFSDDDRASLLGQVQLILNKRNPNAKFSYFSPFISDTNNLKLKYSNISISSSKISENLKSEKFYVLNSFNGLDFKLFDQSTNVFFDMDLDEKDSNYIEFIKNHAGNKNILYINKPRDVETFVLEFINTLPNIPDMENDNDYKAIQNYSHRDYKLLNCLKKGVVYHHASMPDIIKLYVEKIFSKNSNFKYIITTSTLLEGVNIPAEKMFLLSYKKGKSKLTKSQFKNLIGRVCRFSEIFHNSNGNLKLLCPEIFIIDNPIMGKRRNLESFLKSSLDIKEIKDDINNVLLEKCEINDKNKEIINNIVDYIENTEPGTIPNAVITLIQSEIGKLCYKHNVHDFNIKENEKTLIENYEKLDKNLQLNNTWDLLETIYFLFFSNIKIENDNINRFNNEETRKFYAKFLEWRADGKALKEMISLFLHYWKLKENEQPIVYVGQKWGEIKKDANAGISPLHIDISKKTSQQRVNIAILRIKEEQDFVDNFLIKYVEVLNDLNLVCLNLYNAIKYGSTDPVKICLLKNGFSIELTECLTQEKYLPYLKLDIPNNEIIEINKNIKEFMLQEQENPILDFELQYHIR